MQVHKLGLEERDSQGIVARTELIKPGIVFVAMAGWVIWWT